MWASQPPGRGHAAAAGAPAECASTSARTSQTRRRCCVPALAPRPWCQWQCLACMCETVSCRAAPSAQYTTSMISSSSWAMQHNAGLLWHTPVVLLNCDQAYLMHNDGLSGLSAACNTQVIRSAQVQPAGATIGREKMRTIDCPFQSPSATWCARCAASVQPPSASPTWRTACCTSYAVTLAPPSCAGGCQISCALPSRVLAIRPVGATGTAGDVRSCKACHSQHRTVRFSECAKNFVQHDTCEASPAASTHSFVARLSPSRCIHPKWRGQR